MLKKLGIICLFILTFTGLIACTNPEPTTKDEEKSEVEEVEAEEAEEPKKEAEEGEASAEEEMVEPDKEETQQLVLDIVNNIHNVMQTEVDKVGYWTTEEQYKENITTISNNALKPLEKYITESSVETYAEAFAEVMTCQCDSMLVFKDRDVFAGFTITDYSEDTFEAESITVNEVGLEATGWKSNWTFVKEDDNWKLQEHTFTFPSYPGEPVDEATFLNFAFEDIEHAFRVFDPDTNAYTDEIIPIEFIEEIEKEGTHYLVIKMPDEKYSEYGREPGSYIVYNTELGIEDFELTEGYNN